jgi:hypothetical protein
VAGVYLKNKYKVRLLSWNGVALSLHVYMHGVCVQCCRAYKGAGKLCSVSALFDHAYMLIGSTSPDVLSLWNVQDGTVEHQYKRKTKHGLCRGTLLGDVVMGGDASKTT